MLNGKSLTDFTNLFSTNNFKGNDKTILKYIKMDEAQRLNRANEIKDYFIAEICETELLSKRASKYITAFDYFDKSLIVFFSINGGVSIASFASVIDVPVGIVSASFSSIFSLPMGIAKKLSKTTQNKKNIIK